MTPADLQVKLLDVLNAMIAVGNRGNEAQARRYFYPLSLATFDVDEIMEAVHSMTSFRTTMWEKTLQFERQFASYVDCNDAVMVNSGSSADLLLSFLLRNPTNPLLEEGDEVLVPAVTWPTHIWSPLMAGLKVRLVDVDPATFNIDLDDLEAKIGPRTRALFLVHLMGNPCQMDRIGALVAKHKLVLLEDCCEALGAAWNGRQVGTFGLGGAYSFFFSHHICTMEGGMISCSSAEVAENLRIMRAHGWMRNANRPAPPVADPTLDPRYTFVNWGFNLRPTELQAGFGLHQLRKLPGFNERREQIARRIFDVIDRSGHLSRPRAHPLAQPSWFCIPLLVAADAPFTRDDLVRYLENKGVETRPVVTGNIARQPAAKLFPDLATGALPGADAIHDRGLYIGLSPLFTDQVIDRLLDCLQEFLGAY
ncbi:CDP-6-deoxy-D-xylo-4-hexulose-3-dehydrase [Azospirillum lipoferum]|nr:MULTISPECIES: DegT/DnrJ/EryC1/StrS family aminotransferase [Azospirillum]MCP1615386.1 CDP-6-deoxy-D-xylo-4-hexulose-3-dehydrase [Azospirillum lipoferum]MDW5536982.1 DegT/DnrJ/EryC1/StrS family aminotransferase [Azospirillum sp. NL1]